jgi:hypothetical protein
LGFAGFDILSLSGFEKFKVKNVIAYPAKRDERSGAQTYVGAMPRKRMQKTPTTTVERFLLLVTIAIFPLQSYIPTLAGISAMFIIFAGLGVYVLLFRPRSLLTTMRHPVFLAGYLLLGIGLFMEIAHNSSGYADLSRIVFMFMGAVLVATLCRDRTGLLYSMYGFLLSGIFVASVLFLTMYGQLSSVQFSDSQDVDRFRYEVIEKEANVLTADLNDLAYITGRGALVALVLALTVHLTRRRYTFLAIGAFCLVATFLPMSRGGLISFVVSCAAILYAYGAMKPKVFIAVGMLGIGVFVLVPDAVYMRYSFTTEKQAGQFQDSRARVYTAVLTHLPDYVLTGVGISHYWGEWGKRRSGFVRVRDGRVSGTHNCFSQVTVYWGLPGLLVFFLLVWQAYRCVPRPCGLEGLRLCLLGIAVSVFLYMLLSHVLAAKEFSFALGLLVGSAQWIWPKQDVTLPVFRDYTARTDYLPRTECVQ